MDDACCGCGACVVTCNKSSISLTPDVHGFRRPVVDQNTCVGCGSCEKVCPVINQDDCCDRCNEAYWAKALDKTLKKQSSSGGVFGLLARKVLDRNGVVIGAAWKEDFNEVHHIAIYNSDDLHKVMRSKYVQSYISEEVYRQVAEAIRSGQEVLFSGTACQIAGIRRYLGALAYSDLFIAIDVICHGVPSPLLWTRWIAWLRCQLKHEFSEINLRTKNTGWLSYSTEYKCESQSGQTLASYTNIFYDDWYIKAFLKNACLRPSCYECSFKRNCGSDITLGDFWGFQSLHPEIDNELGISAVLCNSKKGSRAFSEISKLVECGEATFEEVLSGNPTLLNSVSPYSGRDEFMKDLELGMTIPKMQVKWNFKPSLRERIVGKIKRMHHIRKPM